MPKGCCQIPCLKSPQQSFSSRSKVSQPLQSIVPLHIHNRLREMEKSGTLLLLQPLNPTVKNEGRAQRIGSDFVPLIFTHKSLQRARIFFELQEIFAFNQLYLNSKGRRDLIKSSNPQPGTSTDTPRPFEFPFSLPPSHDSSFLPNSSLPFRERGGSDTSDGDGE